MYPVFGLSSGFPATNLRVWAQKTTGESKGEKDSPDKLGGGRSYRPHLFGYDVGAEPQIARGSL